jgi:hypothetical protein
MKEKERKKKGFFFSFRHTFSSFCSSFSAVAAGVVCVWPSVLARLRSVAANPTGRSGNGCVPLYWQYPGRTRQASHVLFFSPTITADDVTRIHPGRQRNKILKK